MATAAMTKASQILDDARKVELDAKKVQEAARKVVQAAKNRRATSHDPVKKKEADEAVHAAEQSYATATAKLQHSKELTPKKEQALKGATAVAKEAEATKLEATKTAMAVEVAVAEQKQKDEQAQREFQRLKERQLRLQKQMLTKVAEIKKARQDRLGKKGRATEKDIQAMKAHESHLAESLHAITSTIGESRKELQAHKPKGKPGAKSAAML